LWGDARFAKCPRVMPLMLELYKPFPIPDQSWTNVSMDFVLGLLKAQHFIFVVVD
jgi:hypothetical protein